MEKPLATPRNRMKGQSFRGWLDVFEDVAKGHSKTALLAALPTEIAEAFHYKAIIASGWYPIDWYLRLYEASQRIGVDQRGFAKRMGRATTEQDVKGIYSFIVKFASPGMVFATAQRLLGMYVEDVSTKLVHKEEARVRMQVTIAGSFTELWDELAGGGEAMLSVNGAKRPFVQWKQAGIDSVELTAEWQTR